MCMKLISTFLPFITGAVLLAAIMIYLYNRSVESRKYYVCPNCGESFRTEQMKADSCKVCGCKLDLKNDENVNDKAV